VGSDLGLGVVGAGAREDGRLYPVALLVSGVPRIASASSVDPDPVLPASAGLERPSKAGSLDPAWRPLRSWRSPVTPGRRAGPVRLKPGSPPFSAPPCPSACWRSRESRY